MQEVMAAITTSPWPRSKFLPGTGTAFVRSSSALPYSLSSASAKARRRTRERHAVLRALRPGERRLDLGEIERDRLGEHRIGRVRLAEHSLRLGIGLDQRDALILPAGGLEIIERFLVDREEAAGRAIFRRHVGDGGAILERQMCRARRRRTRRTCRPRPCLRSISVTVSTRSVAVTPSLSLPVRRKPTTSGISIEIGCPSMAASASMPPTPQPSTARPLTIVVWLSVPTSVSGKASVARRLCALVHTVCARYSRFTWWQMPVPGGTTRKLSKAPAGPSAGTDSARRCARYSRSTLVWNAAPCRRCRPSPNGR